ncbi:MAG: class I SAM-dependent methyltransferase [Candidatus Eremiobacteraeota bacterium]|nr:class I SAM-dependent methyltransferase [Candidatus Eremiobacteraeota bacterium]
MSSDNFLHSFYAEAYYHSIVARANHRPQLADFVVRACRKLGRGAPAAGLEMCCGAGLLSADLVERGVAMTAVDLHPEVIECARDHGRRPEVNFEAGNMLDYRLEQPVDFATNVGENLAVLRTNQHIITHLQSMAANILPGGLYILEMGRPWVILPLEQSRVEPPWLVYRYPPHKPQTGSEAGISVSVYWVAEEVRVDPMTQLFRQDLRMVVEKDGSSQEFITEETGKIFYPEEFLALVELAGGFELAGRYSGFRMAADWRKNPTTPEYVVVLRRR